MFGMWMNTLLIFISKHLKCLKYSWLKNIVSFILPIILFGFSINAFTDLNKQQQVIFSLIDQEQLLSYYPGGDDDLLLYTPNTKYYNEFMETLRYKLNMIEERLHPFENADDLNKFFESRKRSRDFAIIFESNNDEQKHSSNANHQFTQSSSAATPPKNINYTIRSTNNNFQTNKLYLNNIYSLADKGNLYCLIMDCHHCNCLKIPFNLPEFLSLLCIATDEYISSGFLALQQSIDITYIESITKQSLHYEFEYEKYPVNENAKGKFTELSVVGYILILIYSFTLINMVLIPMIVEKEDGIKEFLRIVTPYSYFNNVTFFFLNLIFGLLIFLCSMSIAYFYGALDHIQLDTIIVLLTLYVISGISFSFLVSTAFNSVFYAKVAGILFYFAPIFIILYNEDLLSYVIPIFNSVLVIKGLAIFDSFGKKGLTFTCKNLNEIPFDSTYSMIQIYTFLIIDTFIYLMLYYYISHIFPGKCGTPRSFTFPFSCFSKWSKKVEDTTDSIMGGGGTSEIPLSNGFSSDNIAVQIRGLTKRFNIIGGRKNVAAVDNLSMNIYRNEITALLGHNGAGKTTTMAMITGMMSKTNGVICVDGECNIDKYRHTIGYCPQHNVFMRYFTCREHLVFFGKLRGLSNAEALRAANQLLQDLQMIEKSDEYGIHLSGGMKRRLCLGNAIIGNTKIVILDEPSSGLDPESRRELWDILLEMRKNHSILITTHYMEEAEILGDKIAIISHGKLLCYGTPTTLKRKYATGYLLKLLTNDKYDAIGAMRLIKMHVKNATEKNYVHPTAIINLPYEDQSKFSVMLENLENEQETFGISAISITNSSLEDVFISSETTNVAETEISGDQVDLNYEINTIDYEENVCCFSFQQSLAIMYKKWIFMRKEWIYYIISILFPIFAVLICLYSINLKINNHQIAVPFKLNMESIPNSEILFGFIDSSGDILPYKQNAFENLLHSNLKNTTTTLGVLQNLHNDSVELELLKLAIKNTTYFNEHIPATILFYINNNNNNNPANNYDDQILANENNGKQLIRIMFSGNTFHSTATALNLMSNTILEKLTNSKHHKNINNKIETRNAPLLSEKTKITKSDFDFYEMFVPMALFFYVLFYVSLPFQEECTEFKKLQLISPFIYWFAFIVFDILMHLSFCVILFVVHYLTDFAGTFEWRDYLDLSIIYLLYGIAYLPFIYLISKLFSTMSTLYSFMSYVFVLSSLSASFLSANLDNMKKYNVLIRIMSCFPDFAVRHALSSKFIAHTMKQNKQYDFNFDYTYGSNLQDEHDIQRNIDFYYGQMISVTVILFLILVGISEDIYKLEKLSDMRISIKSTIKTMFCINNKKKFNISSAGSSPSSSSGQKQKNINKDVQDENVLTQTLLKEKKFDNNAIIVSNVHKNYGDINAVKGINFTVSKGECFGLLGMNGAGKTTTFKMLTNDIAVTKGEIYFNGMKTKEYLNKKKFGYCPQVDALNNFMTSYQILKYTAWIRGVKRNILHREVMNWLSLTDLLKYKDIPIKEYSGGTKRKLNTAIAMITNPSLVFLDEPTTGVDPISRRFIWNCTKRFNSNKKSIILTSHSMDECEQLCNRLAIMSKGQLKCIGPIQRLKSDYSEGFVVYLIVQQQQPIENIQRVKSEMFELFHTVILKEEYGGTIKFLICEREFKWSNVFYKMQNLYDKYSYIIDDFSICETSLEDIFLRFAKEDLKEATETITNQNNDGTELVEVLSV